jgi:hypothetical protein
LDFNIAIMRSPILSASLAAALLFSACARTPAPTGKWEGFYEDEGLAVAVRLEIDNAGIVRVSAPNAIIENKPSQAERSEIRADLVLKLDRSWPSVRPLPLEFDGEAFRKPGGVAPQLEWDAKNARMTMIYYSPSRPSVRVRLEAVEEFGRS